MALVDDSRFRIQENGTSRFWVYDIQAAVVAATTAVPPTVTNHCGVVAESLWIIVEIVIWKDVHLVVVAKNGGLSTRIFWV